MSTYLHESVEFQAITVARNGETHDVFEVALVPYGERPTDWKPAEELDGKHGIMIQGLAPGEYCIYVRVQDSPETPVMFAGQVRIR